LQDGKFWPARLNSTKLGDVYGVVMDRQRGNRPIILPRDDLLKEAVRDQNFICSVSDPDLDPGFLANYYQCPN
jgi:hypothetical protein